MEKRRLETYQRDLSTQLQEDRDRLEVYEKDRVIEEQRHDGNGHITTEDMDRLQLADMMLLLHNAETQVGAIREKIGELRERLHL